MNDNQKALTHIYNATKDIQGTRDFHIGLAAAYQHLMDVLGTAQKAPEAPKQEDADLSTLPKKE